MRLFAGNQLLRVLCLFLALGQVLSSKPIEENTQIAWDESHHELSLSNKNLEHPSSQASSPSSPLEVVTQSLSRDQLASNSQVIYASYTVVQSLSLSSPLPADSLSSIQQIYSSAVVSLLNLTSPVINCTGDLSALNLIESCEISLLTGFIPSVSQITNLLSPSSMLSALGPALLSFGISVTPSSPIVTSIFSPAGNTIPF